MMLRHCTVDFDLAHRGFSAQLGFPGRFPLLGDRFGGFLKGGCVLVILKRRSVSPAAGCGLSQAIIASVVVVCRTSYLVVVDAIAPASCSAK